MGGNPLLRGVSFKVERRQRLALSGRNGSGKTTLLRMLAGETPIDGGELSFEKGARVALHDQRPPRDRDLTLRDYVLSGCADLVALEEQLAAARAGDGVRQLRSGDARRLCDRPGPAGARRWIRLAPAGDDRGARARVRGGRPRPVAADLLRRRADAWLARPHPGRRPRPAAPRRADEPPGRGVAGVARGAAHEHRCRDRAGRARPLVPGGGRHGGARARGRAVAVLRRSVACLAKGARGARAGARAGDRAPAGRDRAHGAVRDALPGGHALAPGPGAGEEARQDGPPRAGPARRPVAGVQVRAGDAQRPRRPGAGGSDHRGRRAHAPRGRRAVAGARRARDPGGPERGRQDDADRDAGGPPPADRRQAAPGPQRRARLPVPARRRRSAARVRRSRRCSAQPA